MKVLIDADDRFTVVTGKAPAVGRHYVLEEAQNPTSEQSRAFHALAQEFWTTGQHSYDAAGFEEFRDFLKRDLGAGFERFVYVDMVGDKAVIRDAKEWSDVPEHVRRNPDLKDLARGRLKSWSEYTKKERTETIDRLISTMTQAGVNTPKFGEILAGMGAV